MGTKKSATKSKKTGEALRKEAIAVADKNIAAIEAKERAPGSEAPAAEASKPIRKKATSSPKGKPAETRAANDAKPGKTQQTEPSATKGAKAKTTKADKAPKPAKQKPMSGLDYAAQVLAASKEPLNAVAIAERAIAAGWKTEGATPHATLYSAIIREIQVKGSESRFKKVERGQFTATAAAKKGA